MTGILSMSDSNEALPVNVDGVNQCQITLQAKDGPCNVWVLTPERQGKSPGVIFYMDAFGIRPVMIQMAVMLPAKVTLSYSPICSIDLAPTGRTIRRNC